jgi:hypothetical protein
MTMPSCLRRLTSHVLAVSAALVLASCGGSDEGAAAAGASGSLAGAPDAPALAALPTVAPLRASPADVDASAILLTRLSVVLRRDATVGDVNAAAQAAGATGFALATPGSPFLTWIVPRQADAAAAKALAARIASMRGIFVASAARQVQPLALPAGVSPFELDHLLATRFPSAWNLATALQAGCAARKVTVIVPDLFFGAPAAFADQAQGAVEFVGDVPLEPLAGQEAHAHGYEVIGTLTAKFDAVQSHGANPAPGCLRILAIDASGLDTAQWLTHLRRAIEAESGHVIVSSSLGYNNYLALCPGGCVDLPPDFAADARQDVVEHVLHAIQWAAFAAQPAIVDRVLLIQAAGNDANGAPGIAYPGLRSARLGSPVALAAELNDLESFLNDATLWAPTGLPSLILPPDTVLALKDYRDTFLPAPATGHNLTLVGALTNEEQFSQLTASALSNDGADLYAVGEFVSLVDLKIKSGTSYAAPQVAGLASMLWLLDDSLRGQPAERTIAALHAASRSNGRIGGIVDAYATLLAADSRQSRLVLRKAMLDVASAAGAGSDGVFDHLDLQAFLQAYATEPTTNDYGRFDLNGDGATGGIGTQRFDLDAGPLAADGTAFVGTASLRVEGYDVAMNEAGLSDLQILCYYAYLADASGTPLLYDARPEAIAERTRLLGPDRCVGARLDVQLPARVTTQAGLTATVQVPIGHAAYGPAPGLLVELTPTCATVAPTQATTGADGSIAVDVVPAPGCTSLAIDVVVRAAAGAKPLVRQTVNAAAGDSNVMFLLAGDLLFGVPGLHLLAPARRAETSVAQRQADGSLAGCGVFNQPCAAHWSASGGTIIDGRTDGSAVGSVGTYTVGTTFGRFAITASSLKGEFPTTTDVLLIGPVGEFAVHACTFVFGMDESAASCRDSTTRLAAIGPFDQTGLERYLLVDPSQESHLPESLVFDMAAGAPTNFKFYSLCVPPNTGPPTCGVVDPALSRFAISDASADVEHVRFLVNRNNVEFTRVTLTRIRPPL